MAKKAKEMNLKELSADELNRQLTESRQDLFKLRFRAASAPVKNTMQIRGLKRNIARILTSLHQRSQAS